MAAKPTKPLKDSGGHVKVKQTQKQRDAALQAEYDQAEKQYRKQQSEEMHEYQSSGESFGKKTIKIDSSKSTPINLGGMKIKTPIMRKHAGIRGAGGRSVNKLYKD